jgi:hypothetical protein
LNETTKETIQGVDEYLAINHYSYKKTKAMEMFKDYVYPGSTKRSI